MAPSLRPKIRVSVSLSGPMKEQIEALAEEKLLSASAIVRQILNGDLPPLRKGRRSAKAVPRQEGA